jgi:hypothetical protein
VDDAFDLIKLVGGEDDTVERYAAADCAGAGAGDSDWSLRSTRLAQDSRNFFDVLWKNYALRVAAAHVTRVGQERFDFLGVGFR